MLRAYLILLSALSLLAADRLPIHSHNDYDRKAPLVEALSENVRSIEADVHLVGGELLVAHDPEQVQAGRTLQKMYLDPLRQHFTTNRAARTMPLILLVDIKTDAEKTFMRLEEVLAPYAPLLTRMEGGKIITNQIQVIVSGNRPATLMKSLPRRLTFYDGRLTDLGRNEPAAFMPLVSDNWTKHFTWKGEGQFPAPELDKLKQLVQQTHREGKILRFWATPDNETAWGILSKADVDLINTDKVGAAAQFLQGAE